MSTTTTTSPMRWYSVPEVWLMLVMLGATVAGSLALVGTAFEHRDELHAGPSIAAPLPPTAAHPTLPPTSAASPADAATP